MEPASPARLYAALVGALLVALGIVGFFYDASFGGFGDTERALGTLQVNGWVNLLYLATGALGVLLAGAASRPYSLGMGVLYTALAIFAPATGTYLAVGLLGLAAAAGSRSPGASPRAARFRGSKVKDEPTKEPRKGGRLKARAKAAGEGA
jgi:hypothetical protein